jgi:hypothetical protein
MNRQQLLDAKAVILTVQTHIEGLIDKGEAKDGAPPYKTPRRAQQLINKLSLDNEFIDGTMTDMKKIIDACLGRLQVDEIQPKEGEYWHFQWTPNNETTIGRIVNGDMYQTGSENGIKLIDIHAFISRVEVQEERDALGFNVK